MDNVIGNRIKSARKMAGMTQKQLGDACGMADSAIRKYESGKMPKLETIKRIAAALGVEWTEIACGRTVGKETMFFGKSASDFLSEVSSLLLQGKKVLITPSEDGYRIFEVSQKGIN